MNRFTQYFRCLKQLLLILITSIAVFISIHAETSRTQSAIVLDVNGAIGPAAVEYINSGLTIAKEQQAELVILKLNTPGGLASATRDIIRAILNSPIPVIAYVAPSGAHAASAGTYILYASDLAAMAPGTNIGAATPVHMLSPDAKNDSNTLKQKSESDAKAYLRSLAQLRNRNNEWIDAAVSKSASLSSSEALKQGVINFIANDTKDLLAQLNGKTITLQGQPHTLNTRTIHLEDYQANWRIQFLAFITNPNIAYILLMIGVYGLIFEMASPGLILPGIVGFVCLLVSLYALQLLPINYSGLALLVFGVILLSTEIFFPTYGALGIGGIIAFTIGSIMLFHTGSPGFSIALSLIISIIILTALFFLFVISMAIKARLKPVVSGKEQLIGAEAILLINEAGEMRIRLQGELWQVESNNVLQAGQKVKVVGRKDLILRVEPVKN